MIDGMPARGAKGASPVRLIARRDPLGIVEAFNKIEDHVLRKAIATMIRADCC
jgi:hypothetical protein